MSEMMMMQATHLVKGLDPVDDTFAGTKNSDVVSMRDYGRARFIIHMGVGATGSSTLTVEACDDVVPTNTEVIAFWSRETLTGDTEGAITRRAAAGFVYTVQSSKIVEVEVEAKDLPAQMLRSDTTTAGRFSSERLADARSAFEREYLLEKLKSNDWNISRTAEVVGLARESLSRKLRSLKISIEKEKATP